MKSVGQIVLILFCIWIGICCQEDTQDMSAASGKNTPAIPHTRDASYYVVFFKDKQGTPYRVETPEEFLSRRAITRRQKYKITVNEEDLPVSSKYVRAIEDLGTSVYYTTRWLNAVLIQADEDHLTRIEEFSFVKRWAFVAPSLENRSVREARTPSSTPHIKARILSTNALQHRIIGVDEMHALNLKGKDVLIAVIDSGFLGVDQSSFFAEIHVADTHNFVSHHRSVYQEQDEHGSGVLSVMAAEKSSTYKGIAPQASYALYVSEDPASEYRIEEYNLLAALERADSLGADLVNLSLGYKIFDEDSMNYTTQQINGMYSIVAQATHKAFERGIVIVAGAGNAGEGGIFTPSDSPCVLGIAAVNKDSVRMSFSSVASSENQVLKPDVCALGWANVVRGEQFHQVEGTSIASPMITGLMAGLIEAHPELSPKQWLDIIRKSAHRAPQHHYDIGYGIPNFTRAKQFAESSASSVP